MFVSSLNIGLYILYDYLDLVIVFFLILNSLIFDSIFGSKIYY